MVRQREFEQRSRRDHVQGGHLLEEVSKRKQNLRGGLHLVEEE